MIIERGRRYAVTARDYETIARPFRGTVARRILFVLDRGATYLIAVLYLFLLVYLFLKERALFLPVLIVPAVFFVLVGLLRRVINAPRPYEVLDIVPVIPKQRKGRSMPSRHVASASILTMAFVRTMGGWGILMLPLTLLLAATRVISGAHFVRDVVVGFALGIIAGGLLWLW
ncbi:MAG: phosphatase PAP2 family protein [Christensenellaceae bacterium]